MNGPCDEAELRAWFARYGPLPLDERGRFNRERWQARTLPPWSRARAPRPWGAGVGAAVVPGGLAIALHPARGPGRAAALPRPATHLAALGPTRPVLLVSPNRLLLASSRGVRSLTHDPSAANRAWSFDARVVSCTTDSGSVLHIVTAIGAPLYPGPANGLAWPPGHDERERVRTGEIQLLAVSGAGVRPVEKPLGNHIDASVAWSRGGAVLFYAVRRLQGKDGEQVYHVTVGARGFGRRQPLFRSPQLTGMSLARELPRPRALLYGLDPGQSGSLVADGAPPRA